MNARQSVQESRKKIVLCADDYGLNESVSSAIVSLAQQQRISATSCMTNSTDWPKWGQQLLPFCDKIDVGLHVNFTTGQALIPSMSFLQAGRFPRLKTVLVKSICRQLNPEDIKKEVHAQLDRFIDVLGRMPDYLDGEQHVHHFPIIQDVILEVIKARLPQTTYVRSVVNITGTANDHFKAWVIKHTGAMSLQRKLRQAGLEYNRSFSGLYAFSKAEHFPRYFSGFLRAIGHKGLIYCHPGLASVAPNDPLCASRPQEYAYLQGDAFLRDLNRYHVCLSRFLHI